MSDYETVKYATEGAIAIISISRPDAMNAFNQTLRTELLAACERAAEDAAVRAVILTGEGRTFSAGADLKDGLDPSTRIDHMLQNEYRPTLEIIWNMEKPVIAAVGGSVAGIGTSFALVCDLLIMANAFMLSPFTTISLVPDGGLNWLLVHQLGYRRAFQLSVESERITADRCFELGLANKIVPAETLLDEAKAWAKSLAERAPRHATAGSWASTFDVEAPIQQVLRKSKDSAEGVAAFLEKRKPKFIGE